MDKKKVFFIMHMPPPVHGAAMVGKYIHDSKAVNDAFDCHYINPTTAKNLEDVSKFRIGKIFDVFSLIKRVRKEVKELKPDLVYFTANAAGFPFYKDFLLVEALKSCGCSIVIHYHNKGVCTRQDHWLDSLLYKRFFKGLKIILLAENLYSDIHKFVKREDCFILPNGIPSEKTVSTIKSTTDKLHILYLSNMMVEKGVWTLVDACKELKNRGINFVCDFVGGWKDITNEMFVKRIEEYGLQDNVFAYGAKYGDEKTFYLQNADVFVFPTYYSKECFPLVLLEAMRHGLACVSTYEAGIPDIIDEGKTGFLVEKKNPIALADALEKINKDKELFFSMGVEGKKKFETHYTLDIFERNLVGVLKQITEGKNNYLFNR